MNLQQPISFLGHIANEKTTVATPIMDVLELIRAPESRYKERIKALRAITSQKERQLYKECHLANVYISAIFDTYRTLQRKEEFVIGHTQIMVLDYDHVENPNDLKGLVATEPTTLAAFISPSGDGLKVLVRLDGATPKNHTAFFAAVDEHYSTVTGLASDIGARKITLGFYITCDEDMYLNTDCEAFSVDRVTQEHELKYNPPPIKRERPEVTTEDYLKCESLVIRLEETSTNIAESYEDWLKVGASLANLGEAGRDLYHRVSALSAKYDFWDCEKKFDRLSKEPKKAGIASFIWMVDQHLPKETTRQKKEAPANDSGQFYFGKYDKHGNVADIGINITKLLELLRTLGFRYIKVDGQNEYVRVVGKVLEIVERRHIIYALHDYVKTMPDVLPLTKDEETEYIDKARLIEKLYNGQGTYLCDEKLSNLGQGVESFDMMKDTATQAYYFYQNGMIEVTASDIKLIPYTQLPKYIWRSQIIPRDFNKVDYIPSNFNKFFYNISAHGDTVEVKTQRYSDMKTLVGYLLHSYFFVKLKCIIFTDSSVSEGRNGRSGKSLLMKGIHAFLSTDSRSDAQVSIIDGAKFSMNEKFAFQKVSPQCRVLVLNDIEPHVKSGDLFTIITEGVTVEKKNMNPFTVESKIAITKNQPMQLPDESSVDRFLQPELTSYYSTRFAPFNEFDGEFFFSNTWTVEKWHEFDSFMCSCVQEYLKRGLVMPQSINIERRQFLALNDDFQEFWTLGTEGENPEIKPGQKIEKRELYNKFIDNYERAAKHVSAKRFTAMVTIACESTPAFGPMTEENHFKSNGKNYYIFPDAKAVGKVPTDNQDSTTPVTSSEPIELPDEVDEMPF